MDDEFALGALEARRRALKYEHQAIIIAATTRGYVCNAQHNLGDLAVQPNAQFSKSCIDAIANALLPADDDLPPEPAILPPR